MGSGDEDALRRRVGDAEVVRETFDGLPQAVCVMEGPELRIVAANAAHRALIGRTDYIGQTMREVFADVAGQRLFELVEQVYWTGEPGSWREWRIQLVVDDSGEPRDFFLDVDLLPRRDADGPVHGVQVLVTDVTARVIERRAAHERAAEAEQRYAQARDVIATLQQELLPRGVPVAPGVRLAASYLLADADTAAGGDWFDAVALPGGRVGLAVGDVVGHGVAASAVMGQLRVVLSERLADGGDVVAALGAVDRLAERMPGARATTVCVAVLDPAAGELTWCTAGHPPPLVVAAGGEGRYLAVTGSGPLGTGAAFTTRTDRLGPGDVVLLYTDGIMERPGRTSAEAEADLRTLAADAAANRALRTSTRTAVDRVCSQTLELLVRATGHTDDVTLLAAQIVPAVAPVALDLPAGRGDLAAVREALTRWLDELGVARDAGLALTLAAWEAASNVVDHAYAGGPAPEPGRLRVTADVDEHGAVVTVADDGRWRTDAGIGGGRGMLLVRSLVHAAQVDRRPDGTTVTLRHPLLRPAQLGLVSIATPVPAVPEPFDAVVTRREPTVLSVRGPVDAATAGLLRAAVGREGGRELVLDLARVTMLASAGVQLLHELAGPDLRLVAPPGSPARSVLALVDLEHLLAEPAEPAA
ncbi:MAG: SpoIIE family protein phosphatase [Pseudonocardia sp.]